VENPLYTNNLNGPNKPNHLKMFLSCAPQNPTQKLHEYYTTTIYILYTKNSAAWCANLIFNNNRKQNQNHFSKPESLHQLYTQNQDLY